MAPSRGYGSRRLENEILLHPSLTPGLTNHQGEPSEGSESRGKMHKHHHKEPRRYFGSSKRVPSRVRGMIIRTYVR